MMTEDGEISLEQLYKMLHISKRKAAWMLQNGIIPCRMRNTKTHRYAVRLEDVEEYLRKSKQERRNEIPVGKFNAKPTKQTVSVNRIPIDTVALTGCYISLEGEAKEAFKAFVATRLRYINDALTVNQVATAIGYSAHMVIYHIEKKHLEAVRISGKYIIAKHCLVDFIVSDQAFAIVNKSTWHVNTILKFKEKSIKTMSEPL